MECEDIINKKFNRSFIGYDIGQVDAFLDELYSEMQALKAELEMLRTDSKTPKTKQSQHQNGCSHPFFLLHFQYTSCTEKINENLKKLPRREGFRE